MKRIQTTRVPILVIAAFLLCSCGSAPSGSTTRYPVAHAGVAHRLEGGTVISTREVVIDGKATALGTAVGAGIGTAVGAIAVPVETTSTTQGVISQTPTGDINVTETTNVSTNSNENRAAMAVGAAVGAVVGRKVEKKLSEIQAQELTIKLDSGETIVVVQQLRQPYFYDQERVKVYTTGYGNSRVFHDDEDPFLDPETNAYLIDGAEIANEVPEVNW